MYLFSTVLFRLPRTAVQPDPHAATGMNVVFCCLPIYPRLLSATVFPELSIFPGTENRIAADDLPAAAHVREYCFVGYCSQSKTAEHIHKEVMNEQESLQIQ
jgi:hypothetical protein